MPNLEPLLKAASVAVVGASPKPESFGWFALRQLLDFGFAGRIYPVNPGYEVIEGLVCSPSVADIAEPVDCVAICVADARLEAALSDVADAGARAAVIFGSAAGFAATGEPLTRRLAQLARDADVALMGASCMGFFNFVDSLFLTGYPYHRPPSPGTISFITHSGSTLSAVAKNTRGMNFNYVISPGQELVLTAADYLKFVVEQPETRVVGLFLETIRDPDVFCEALRQAEERDIPVVLLKVGRSERGARMAMAHTGALAGTQATIEAVASRHNLVLVRTMEEMLDTLELLNSGRRPTTSGLASVHDSGGERGMLVDLAGDVGVEFADLAPATLDVLAETLDPGLEPGNPADLWGSGHNWQHVYRTCVTAMLADPAVGAFNYGIDFNIGSRLGPDYKAIAVETFRSTEKPLAVTTNVAAGIDPSEATDLRAAGIPVLMGAGTGLLAFRHLFAYAKRRTINRQPPRESEVGRDDALDLLMKAGQPIVEADALATMGRFGLPVIESRRASTAQSVVAAAEDIGYPIVLKTAAPGLLHKSDVGGVVVGLRNAKEVGESWADMEQRLGPAVLVQPQADLAAGVELFFGGTQDPQFGPLVTLGLGGVLIEVLRDSVSFLAPVSPEEVLERLPELRGFAMLGGVRGRAAVDLNAMASAVSRFSLFVAGLGDQFAEIDANPVLATGRDLVILDALIVPAARAE